MRDRRNSAVERCRSSSPLNIVRRSPAELSPPSPHHAVVVSEDSGCYFTIARLIEEVNASSSCTCVEHGGAVRSVLDREFMGRTVIGLRRSTIT